MMICHSTAQDRAAHIDLGRCKIRALKSVWGNVIKNENRVVEDSPTYRSRNSSIDVIRYLSLLGVIVLHVKSSIDFQSDNIIGFFILSMSNIAVPTFFVAAGYFLKLNSFGIVKSLWSTIERIAPLHLFWLGAYIVFIASLTNITWIPRFTDLFTGGYAYHLWFLPALASAMIINIVARQFLGHYGNLAICSMIAMIGLARGGYHDLLSLDGSGQRSGFLMAPLFIWIGIDIARRHTWHPTWRLMLGIVASVFLIQLCEYALLGYATEGKWLTTRPFIIMTYPMGAAMFLLARSIPGNIWPRSLVHMSRFTFGVYAIHLAMQAVLLPILRLPGLPGLLVIVPTIFLTSSLIVLGMSKIRFLRDYVS